MIQDLINISKEAGEIIREGFGKKLKVEYKSNETNLVTEIDKASEKHIIDFIKKEYPTHNILAEESGEKKASSEYLWVVDPLDGTTNFAHGLPIFSVSIGLQKNGKTIMGVVYDVMQNIAYVAEEGNGAYANAERIKVSLNEKINHSVLVTGFPYNIADNPENALGIFSALTRKARAIRRLGSAAIDLCYVARGVFDGFWELFLHPWDICAGMLIVEEAGGFITDFSGKEIDIYAKRILASNKVIHSKLIDIINNSSKPF